MDEWEKYIDTNIRLTCEFLEEVGPWVWFSDYLCGYCTYDEDISYIMAKETLEVMNAINTKKTFEYIEDDNKYLNYIKYLNMPFLDEKVEWGGSIRGAWWKRKVVIEADGLFNNDGDQIKRQDFHGYTWNFLSKALVRYFGGLKGVE